MTIQSAVTARRNFDYIGLAQILLGFLMTTLPTVLPGEYLGYAVMFLGLAQLVIKWYRTQLGLAGDDIVRPDDGQNSGA